MRPYFTTFKLRAQDSALQMQKIIESELIKYGEPLNWLAIDGDPEEQTITIEALIKVRSPDPTSDQTNSNATPS